MPNVGWVDMPVPSLECAETEVPLAGAMEGVCILSRLLERVPLTGCSKEKERS